MFNDIKPDSSTGENVQVSFHNENIQISPAPTTNKNTIAPPGTDFILDLKMKVCRSPYLTSNSLLLLCAQVDSEQRQWQTNYRIMLR